MPRRARVHVPGSFHHLTAHGVDSRPLFEDDDDRWRFLGILGEVTREIGWRCLAFCLMTTHYHLLVQERDAPIWRAMRLLNGRYVVAFNKRHGRVGHLLNGRYRDTPIEKEEHLFAALRYIALNPVEAGACGRAEDWPWSSYPQLVGLARPSRFVSRTWVLAQFAPHPREAMRRARSFVEQVPGT
jgi:REP element-mobilizing transposase RayT